MADNAFADLIPQTAAPAITAAPSANQFSDLIPPLQNAPAIANQAIMDAEPTAIPGAGPATGIGEAVLNNLTGVVGQSLGGLAGLGTMAARGLGLTNADPTNVIHAVENRLTYQPQGATGQAITQGLSSAYQNTLGKAANWAGDVGNRAFGPAVGTALYTGVNAMPMALGMKGAPEEAAAAAEPSAVANAVNLGYKLKPSEAGGGVISRGVEGLAGSSRLEALFNEKNQGLTNNLVGQQLGIPSGTPITQDLLNSLKEGPNAIYNQVGNLGIIKTDPIYQQALNNLGNVPGTSFPLAKNADVEGLRTAFNRPSFNAGDALQQIKQMRKLGNSNIIAGKNYSIANAPLAGELGQAQLGVANALESQISRALPQIGADPNLISQFQNARQRLAQIHSVSNALIGDTGNVSAQALAKQANKGVPLSGNLADVAQTAQDFPHVTRDVEKIRNFQPFGSIHGMGGGGMVGGMGLMELMHNPQLGIPMLATMASTPLFRGALGSDLIQGGLANPARFQMTPTQLDMLLKGTSAGLIPQMANQSSQ